MSKSVVFTFGRFNPPTTGHELLANRLRDVAKKERIREIRLYPSQSQDSKKNPLSFRDKVKFLRKAFSGIKVVADTSIKTIFQACEKLSDEGYKNVVLVDDVLYTGRTIRSGLDALLAFGRPAKVELLCFVDRRFKRDLPIQSDYVGITVDSLRSERVSVEWKEIEGEDKVKLYTPESNG